MNSFFWFACICRAFSLVKLSLSWCMRFPLLLSWCSPHPTLRRWARSWWVVGCQLGSAHRKAKSPNTEIKDTAKENGKNDCQKSPVLAFTESHATWGKRDLALKHQTKTTQYISFQMMEMGEEKRTIQLMLKTFQLVDGGLKSKLKMSSKAELLDHI